MLALLKLSNFSFGKIFFSFGTPRKRVMCLLIKKKKRIVRCDVFAIKILTYIYLFFLFFFLIGDFVIIH